MGFEPGWMSLFGKLFGTCYLCSDISCVAPALDANLNFYFDETIISQGKLQTRKCIFNTLLETKRVY